MTSFKRAFCGRLNAINYGYGLHYNLMLHLRTIFERYMNLGHGTIREPKNVGIIYLLYR